MAHIAHDPEGPSPVAAPMGALVARGWWHEFTALLHDLFDSDELRERRELLARTEAARRRRRKPAAPAWLRLD